jgi:hypothetical protein
LQQQFAWEGDHNFYQGFGSFWKIVDLTFPSEPQAIAFPKGEAVVATTSAVWSNPPAADRAVDTLTVDEFLLADFKPGEPMRFEASDGKPAGLDAARIPASPSQPKPAPDVETAPDASASRSEADRAAVVRPLDFDETPPPRED